MPKKEKHVCKCGKVGVLGQSAISENRIGERMGNLNFYPKINTTGEHTTQNTYLLTYKPIQELV